MYLTIYGRENYYLVYFRLYRGGDQRWPLNMLARNTFWSLIAFNRISRRFYCESAVAAAAAAVGTGRAHCIIYTLVCACARASDSGCWWLYTVVEVPSRVVYTSKFAGRSPAAARVTSCQTVGV